MLHEGMMTEGMRPGNTTCRICGNASGNTRYEAREMMLGFGDRFAYFQCSACQCLQILEPPTDMQKYYPPGYYSYAAPPLAAAPPPGALRRAAKVLRDVATVSGRGVPGRLLSRFSPNPALSEAVATHFPGDAVRLLRLTRRSRILDVGCGAGTFLSLLRQAGFQRVLGIDAFLERDIEYSSGLRILKTDIHGVSGPWDVIMFHHSFEHLPDPREVLRAAAALLAPRGACVLRLPVVPSYAWETYGVDWVQFDAPRHLFLHSIDSVCRLARDVGLEVVKVAYDSTALQFYGSEQYRRGIPLFDERSYMRNPARSIFSAAEMDEFERRAAALNQEERGDQAALYLRHA